MMNIIKLTNQTNKMNDEINLPSRIKSASGTSELMKTQDLNQISLTWIVKIICLDTITCAYVSLNHACLQILSQSDWITQDEKVKGAIKIVRGFQFSKYLQSCQPLSIDNLTWHY